MSFPLEGRSENYLPAVDSPALRRGEAGFVEGVERPMRLGHDAVTVRGTIHLGDIVSAVDRIEATASLVILSIIVVDGSASEPLLPTETGWADPIFVVGAMAATCAA